MSLKTIGVTKREVFDLTVKIQSETGGTYMDSIDKALEQYKITWEDLKQLCINS